MRPVIVSLGSLPIDKGLRSVAQEFGWSLVRVPARRQIQKTCKAFDVVAILFEPKAIAASWQEALTSWPRDQEEYIAKTLMSRSILLRQ